LKENEGADYFAKRVKVKVKLSHYRPEQVNSVPGV
jgi:hypothetical protein